MMLVRAPGVYRVQHDTRLLIRALSQARIPHGGRVLDIGTGTGALAVAAAHHGARTITAVDVSRRAVATAWLNCRLRGLTVRALHGDFEAILGTDRFDLVLANPPYVPAPRSAPDRGAARAWNAGEKGRAFLDRLCAMMPHLLESGGVALTVHSCLCHPDTTVAQLREGGLEAAVVARSSVPFGPVMRELTPWLTSTGLIEPGQNREDLVVIRADKPRP
ncbi:HemK2/MTQ2 family protein methyltransferase [Nocardia pseudovaccinii]|uniref:HemK2/MTQ2 family protein methyltransferase n=1 Tax=Nocardia pseudovaccinii TaxID=189540 RepID=UPI0007A47235|nr:HemK2/MTQ2 family protein methyltransferase [Nocardia pseudovaccinii]